VKAHLIASSLPCAYLMRLLEDMPLRTTADRMKEQPTMREKAHLIASSLPCAYLMRLLELLPGRKAAHAVVMAQQCRELAS